MGDYWLALIIAPIAHRSAGSLIGLVLGYMIGALYALSW